jgi:hypothetical protein
MTRCHDPSVCIDKETGGFGHFHESTVLVIARHDVDQGICNAGLLGLSKISKSRDRDRESRQKLRALFNRTMPITWSQVKTDLDPKCFTIRTVPALLAKTTAWQDYCDGQRSLEQAIKRLGKMTKAAA